MCLKTLIHWHFFVFHRRRADALLHRSPQFLFHGYCCRRRIVFLVFAAVDGAAGLADPPGGVPASVVHPQHNSGKRSSVCHCHQNSKSPLHKDAQNGLFSAARNSRTLRQAFLGICTEGFLAQFSPEFLLMRLMNCSQQAVQCFQCPPIAMCCDATALVAEVSS